MAEAGKEDVDKAVRAARKAFDEGPWPRMTAKQRGRILQKFADLMEQHADELAALESLVRRRMLRRAALRCAVLWLGRSWRGGVAAAACLWRADVLPAAEGLACTTGGHGDPL